MRLPVHRAEYFTADFDRQYRWYLAEAGETIAERYLAAVSATLESLAEQPDLGRIRRFRNPMLCGLRSIQVESPFQRLLIFYCFNETQVIAERLMHGARDLPRRLVEPAEAE